MRFLKRIRNWLRCKIRPPARWVIRKPFVGEQVWHGISQKVIKLEHHTKDEMFVLVPTGKDSPLFKHELRD